MRLLMMLSTEDSITRKALLPSSMCSFTNDKMKSTSTVEYMINIGTADFSSQNHKTKTNTNVFQQDLQKHQIFITFHLSSHFPMVNGNHRQQFGPLLTI